MIHNIVDHKELEISFMQRTLGKQHPILTVVFLLDIRARTMPVTSCVSQT
jgi:hypothetical protein